MIDFTKKFYRVVEHYNLEQFVLNDIACAICIADEHIGTNEKSLNISRLFASTEIFSNMQSSHGVSQLPRVQVMRVMCDVLILALASHGVALNEVYLTNPSAKIVGSHLGFAKTSDNYADEDECIKIMDRLMEFEEDNEEIYPYIESVLAELSKHSRGSSFTFQQVYLPSKYNAHGFPVNRVHKPRNVDIEYQFLSAFVTNFATYLINADDDMDFASRLISIFEGRIQIGVRGVAEKDLYIDKLCVKYNVAVMNMYQFILSANIGLTRQSVEKIFQVFELFERDRVR